MDIHSKVTITTGTPKDILKYELPLHKEFKDINFNDNTAVLSIKEYYNLKIKFEDDNTNSKLFFNMFDILDDYKINVENDEYYITPGSVDVIDISNKDMNNVLVPGYYHIKVKSEAVLHGIIEIIPKDLEGTEWLEMYEEIESYSHGLAFSLNQKSNNKLLKTRQSENDLINILSYINKNYKYLKSALNYIRLNPRYTLEKRYNWVNKNFSPLVDGNTIKRKLKHPEKDDYLYSPKRVVNYNIKENQWIKRALTNINSHLNKIRETILEKQKVLHTNLLNTNKNYKNEINNIRQAIRNLEETKQRINHIINDLSKISMENWYQGIKMSHTTTPPLNTLMNQNYKVIFQWYESIFKEKMTLIYGDILQNSWKKTDELYEIWCFINVIEVFKNLGFNIISGWIYDDPSNELTDGTKIILEKEKFKVNIYYNLRLKDKSSNTTIKNPLYTKNPKNKPDIRADFYVNDTYITSIIMDAKYRKFKSIIHYKNGSLNQLHAYYDSPKSNKHLLGAPEYRRESHRVIYSVLVLYPQDNSISEYTRDKERLSDHEITFIEYSPNKKDNNLEKSIIKTLDYIEAVYFGIF